MKAEEEEHRLSEPNERESVGGEAILDARRTVIEDPADDQSTRLERLQLTGKDARSNAPQVTAELFEPDGVQGVQGHEDLNRPLVEEFPCDFEIRLRVRRRVRSGTAGRELAELLHPSRRNA
ncbi:MAG TPA: hypothetical protein VGX00_06425 [Thermoplasmata archaeon]|nr:hypothetical protein [Thermoplasmata archaeon]